MLGVAAVPAVLQAVLFCFLPESPRWYVRQKRFDEAVSVLKRLYPSGEGIAAYDEVAAAASEWHHEDNPQAQGINFRDILVTKRKRMALTAGVGMQVFQQLVGINTVMYYSPSIIEFAGYASHETALLLSAGVAAMNAIGTVAGIFLIDRCGRRRLAILSLVGVISALCLLSVAFHLTSSSSPNISWAAHPDKADITCPAFPYSGNASTFEFPPTCTGCLQANCGFCAAAKDEMLPGNCFTYTDNAGHVCQNLARSWFTRGCPSDYGWLALLGLVLYLLAFAPGMGPVPWTVNSEIYSLQDRGVCGGIAATANWISNFVIAQTFLSLTDALGTSKTFLLFAGLAVAALLFVLCYLPETKGLSFEQVELLFKSRENSSSWMPFLNTDAEYVLIGGEPGSIES